MEFVSLRNGRCITITKDVSDKIERFFSNDGRTPPVMITLNNGTLIRTEDISSVENEKTEYPSPDEFGGIGSILHMSASREDADEFSREHLTPVNDDTPKCTHENVVLYFRTASNGTKQFFDLCPECGWKSKMIAKASIKKPEEVPEYTEGATEDDNVQGSETTREDSEGSEALG